MQSTRSQRASASFPGRCRVAAVFVRRAALRVQCVQQHSAAAAPVRGAAADRQQPRQAVLCTKFKAHDASITALSVLNDEPGSKTVVTASMDKTLAVWAVEGCDLEGPQLTCTRLEVPGGPVFSLHRGIRTKVTDVNVKPREPVLFCGLASKEVVALPPDTLVLNEQTHMNGHTGWVRSLASSGKYLFSCGCNNLHQWDQAYAVPKEVRSTSLFTGDILALAATSSAVFTAGADGSLRCWSLGKKGDLSEACVREKAHEGRIMALAVSGSLLFSAGYDGDIKAWDVSTLELVMEAKAAHGGERIRALVIGPAPAASPGSSPGNSHTSTPAPSPPPPAAEAEPAQVAAEAAAAEAAPAHEEAATAPAGTPAAAELASTQVEAAPVDPALLDVAPVEQAAAAAAALASEPDMAADSEPADSEPPAAAPPAAASDAAPVPPPAAEATPMAPAEADVPVPADAAVEQPAAATEAAAAAAVPAVAGALDGEGISCWDPLADTGAAEVAGAGGAVAALPAAAQAPSSPCPLVVLYSGGDDGLVRRWDCRLLSPLGEPLQVHTAAVKALAVGSREVLVSGDAAGEVAVWLV